MKRKWRSLSVGTACVVSLVVFSLNVDAKVTQQEALSASQKRNLLSRVPAANRRGNSSVVAQRRPGWGRDYGPSYDLPYQLAKDPFADAEDAEAARAAKETATAGNAQQQQLDALNPLGQPLGDTFTQPLPSPEPGHYQPDYVPGSPNGVSNVISPTDTTEVAGVLQSGVADSLAGKMTEPPDVSRFKMRSCEGVCQRCMLTTADHPAGHKCKCFANCLQGMNSTICTSSPAGWSTRSLGNRVTRPDESWQATCNFGNKDCTECVSNAFVNKVKNCQGSRDPGGCLTPMRTSYVPPPTDSRERVHFCTNPSLPSCERLPTNSAKRKGFNASGGWKCFDRLADCEASKLPRAEFQDVIRAPSVWETAHG